LGTLAGGPPSCPLVCGGEGVPRLKKKTGTPPPKVTLGVPTPPFSGRGFTTERRSGLSPGMGKPPTPGEKKGGVNPDPP
jgi:hypothetical protein